MSFTLEHWGKYMDYTWTVNTYTNRLLAGKPVSECLLLDMDSMLPRSLFDTVFKSLLLWSSPFESHSKEVKQYKEKEI